MDLKLDAMAEKYEKEKIKSTQKFIEQSMPKLKKKDENLTIKIFKKVQKQR